MNVLLPLFQVHTARETGQESAGGRGGRIELQTKSIIY